MRSGFQTNNRSSTSISAMPYSLLRKTGSIASRYRSSSFKPRLLSVSKRNPRSPLATFSLPRSRSSARTEPFPTSHTQTAELDRSSPPSIYQRSSSYARYACEDLSEESENDRGIESSQHQTDQSTLDNVDEWKWKLTLLLRNNDEHEVVSREKKDRRDFKHLSSLATRMGLFSSQYTRVVVFSKIPLPNYRPDLDDSRPQREVFLPSVLRSEVEGHLKNHLSNNTLKKDDFLLQNMDTYSDMDNAFEERPRVLKTSSDVLEKMYRHKSLRMRQCQQDWKESPEGKKMIEFRKSLPFYKERDALIRAISENQVIVVSGETGCGKTTQLPQYILESEIDAARGAVCNIICTQPRRISAMAVSERVAAERGEKLGETVGYKVRLEGIKGKDTRLMFCTTGILMRRLLVDRNLNGVTHVIIDEIHERGMNEDFLIIILKDLIYRRPDLRLILMSATLNAELFSSYFGGAPMMSIPGFTYPVRSHFLENILERTLYRLTPNNQIDDYGQEKLWKMQKQALRKKKTHIASTVEDALAAANFREYGLTTQNSLSCWNPDSVGFNLIEQTLYFIAKNERPGAILVFMTGWEDINSLKDQLQMHPFLGDYRRVLILACHGSMVSSEQKLIFDRPEDGIRKIVLATNMAETSITINDVVFVVDCGKAKETSYDALNNTSCLLPSWISKASARQRRGRAGRVQPGECYHLYPKCVYETFCDYQLPEILRMPLQSLCLQIKSLQLGSISEFLSRALQPPDPLSVKNAITYLKIIGALDEKEKLTILGKHLSVLPVEPKLGKMLILGTIFNCFDQISTIVAGLSVRNPFLMPPDKKDHAMSAKANFAGKSYSDHLTLVRAYNGWRDAERTRYGSDYCYQNFLSSTTFRAIDSLKRQFFFLLKDTGLMHQDMETSNSSADQYFVRAIICAGLFPGICAVINKGKSILMKTMEDGPVLLQMSSVNFQEQRIPYPWLVFSEKVKVNSVFLSDSTAVSDSMLLLFGGKVSHGGIDGHLKIMGGYFEFFMEPAWAKLFLTLKSELEDLVQAKLVNPNLEIGRYEDLVTAVRLLVSRDECEGRFVVGRKEKEIEKPAEKKGGGEQRTVEDCKGRLQTLLTRAGNKNPSYRVKQLKNNQFVAYVRFNEMEIEGLPCRNKKQAEKEAAAEALRWLAGGYDSPVVDLEPLSGFLKVNGPKHNKRGRHTSSGSYF